MNFFEAITYFDTKQVAKAKNIVKQFTTEELEGIYIYINPTLRLD